MTLAGNIAIGLNAGVIGAIRVSHAARFIGLSPAEEDAFSKWMDRTVFDTAQDLMPRAWNIAGVLALVGIFEVGCDRASWLIVRHSTGWMLMRCADGIITNETTTLTELLDAL